MYDEPKTHVIKGNILDCKDAVVAHCCNTRNTMSTGVAKALRDRFPEVYEADCTCTKECKGDCKMLLGKCIAVEVETDKEHTNIKTVCNIYGQQYYGYDGQRYIDYEAIYTGLEKLKFILIDKKEKTVAIPLNIGCNRGGGYWPIVREMIMHVFANTDITINFYEL